MGQGDLTQYQVDFLISGKEVFDWLDDADLVTLAPFDAAGYPTGAATGP